MLIQENWNTSEKVSNWLGLFQNQTTIFINASFSNKLGMWREELRNILWIISMPECCHNTFSSIKRHHAVFSLLCIDVSYSSWRCAFRVNWLGFLLFCYKNGQKWTKNTLEIEEIIDTAYPPWHRDSCTNWRCTDLLHKWTKNVWQHHVTKGTNDLCENLGWFGALFT